MKEHRPSEVCVSLGVSWKKIAAPTSMASRGPRSKHPHHSRQCPKSLETLARDAKDGAGGPSLPPAHHHSGQWERREKTGLALRGPLCSPHHHSGQWERREKTGLALRGPLCSPHHHSGQWERREKTGLALPLEQSQDQSGRGRRG